MSYLLSHPDVDGETVIPEHALTSYAAKGWVIKNRIDSPAAATPPELKQPAKSASAAEWKTYAVVKGMAYDKAMAATRDELAQHYNPEPPAEPRRPQKNDSTEAWRAYAATRGMPREQAEQMSRDGDDGLISYIDQLDTDQTQEN